MRLLRVFACGLFATSLLGCRSAVVDASVVNATAQPIQLLEVDYPSASFGTQTLPAGQTFHYRLKVLGSGPLKITWTDAAHQDHSAKGPTLVEHTSGSLVISITPTGVTWNPPPSPRP